MPRRSLASAEPTPTRVTRQKRHATGTSSSPPPAKRRRKDDDPQADSLPVPALEQEAELEAWQEFVADHYEMVEQLPLELHRNFRLLRELDDGSATQTDRLQALIREYINYRLGPIDTLLKPTGEQHLDNGVSKNRTHTAAQGGYSTSQTKDPAGPIEQPYTTQGTTGNPKKDSEDASWIVDGALPVQDDGQDADGEYEVEEEEVDSNHLTTPSRDPAVPISLTKTVDESNYMIQRKQTPDSGGMRGDGQGDIIVPPNPLDSSEPPVQPPVKSLVFPGPTDIGGSNSTTNILDVSSSVPVQGKKSGNLLSEIGRLAREIVRNGEEKLAVAIGAYNAIDRHIRALDSALSAQEASILLGLRDANSSVAVDGTTDEPGDSSAIVEENGEMVIGMGGGRRRDKKRKKGRQTIEKVEKERPPGIVIPPEFEIDPNEPKYCYCNQVSFGEMLGCENDECPLEWFHLPCTGLSAIPTGKWYCNVCRPKTSLGQSTNSGLARKKSHRKR